MPLTSPRFAGDQVLEQCLKGTNRLTKGSQGPSVQRVQQALLDANLQLQRFAVDGKFGPLTADAVIKFQKSKRLRLIDGIVGRETMGALDAAFPGGGKSTPLPPGIHWGVDTAAPADFPITANGTQTTLFDLVTQKLGMPEFWGRYLHKGVSTNTAALTTKEVQFIKDRSDGKCRILLIANIAGPRFSAINAKATGAEDAKVALNKCGSGALNVPAGVFIYADIEPNFVCKAGWFEGWWEVMEKAGRGRGGVYASPRELGFSRPYKTALKNTLEPFSKSLNPDPQHFFIDDPRRARLIWSQRPVPFFKRDIDPENFKPNAYTPTEPDFIQGMTVLWQYGGDCRLIPGNSNSRIDMDFANDQGLRSMWDLTRS
jgi:hypothetical protein